jgi:peptide/nickel transport system substrate-binding protein
VGTGDRVMRKLLQRRWLGVAAIATLATTIIAACGDDDDQGAAPVGTDSAAINEAIAPPSSDSVASSGDPVEPSSSTGTPTPSDSSESGCTAETIGGSVSMGVFSETGGLDPLMARGSGTAGGTEITAIFDTLTHYNPATGEFEPRVAETLESNDELTEWTLRLRPDVLYGNGDTLTAADVKASIERHLDPANVAQAVSATENITEMRVVDDRTLVFILNAPWGSFPALLSSRVGAVVNPRVLEQLGADAVNTLPEGGGVGPFEVVRFAPGEELVLRGRSDYWGGTVCLEELRFVFIPGANGTYDALRDDVLQVAFLRSPQVIAQAKADGYGGTSVIQNAGGLFMLNHAPPAPPSDLTVRQALAAALDPARIDERAWNGQGLPGTAIIADESTHFNDQQGPQADVERAAALVEEAKASGWDGTIEVLCFDDPVSEDICVAAMGMLELAGMNVTIQPTTIPTLIERVLAERDFEMAIFGFNVPDSSPWERLYGFLATGNAAGYSDSAMDAALDQLRAADDPAEEREALAEIQTAWNDSVPHLIYGAVEEYIATAAPLAGVEVRQDSTVYFDNAYFDE